MGIKKRTMAVVMALALLLVLAPASRSRAEGYIYGNSQSGVLSDNYESGAFCFTIADELAKDSDEALEYLTAKVTYDTSAKTVTVNNVKASDLSVYEKDLIVSIEGECEFDSLTADKSFTLKVASGAKLTCKEVRTTGFEGDEEVPIETEITLDPSVKKEETDKGIVYTCVAQQSGDDNGQPAQTPTETPAATTTPANDGTAAATQTTSQSSTGTSDAAATDSGTSGVVTAGSGASKAVYVLDGSSATYRETKVKSSAKKITVPDSIQVNGKKYPVSKISSGAMKNCKKVTSVTIGKNVTKIGASAFSGCKKLKTLTIQSKKLTKSGIKNAFKGSYIKNVKVPKAKKSAYKKFMTKKVTKSKYVLKIK